MEEQVNRLGELLQDVAAVQRDSLARANVLAQIRMRPPVRRSMARRLVAGMPRLTFALPALAAAGACIVWWQARPLPLTFAVGDAASFHAQARGGDGNDNASRATKVGDRLQAPADARLPLAFSDGSSIALDRGAQVRVTALDSRGATVQMEKGRAEVNVHHRRNTRWELDAGPFQVAVTGTRFSIEWNDQSDALTVVMSEGTVEVRGKQLAGSAPVIVTAGQRFHATARESRWTLAAASEPELVPVGGALPATSPSSTSVAAPSDSDEITPPPPGEAPPAATAAARGISASSSAAARSWQALARSGRYQEALHLAERGGFNKACRKLGAEDLVQLGDVARLARNPGRAEQAYHMARRRFPASDRPAFALGLVAFEQRRDYRAAGKWFDTYVQRYPKGALAREALGREMESWHRAGDAARARRAARSYLTEAPTGPYAPLAQQIVSP